MADYVGEGQYKRTLCWSCQRAVRKEVEGKRCPWSHDFKPVPGWDAEPTKKYAEANKGEARYVDSYHVNACPLYLKDKPQAKNLDWLKYSF